MKKKSAILLSWFFCLLLLACSDDTADSDASAADLVGADLATVDGGADSGTEAGVDASGDGPVMDAALPDSALPPDMPTGNDPGRCATPTRLTLSGGKATVSGDTTKATNEFAKLSCGNSNGPFDGGQLYYRVALAAGKTYKLQLSPSAGFDAALYAFAASTSCQAAAVNSACSSYHSDIIGSGSAGTEQIKISTSSAGDWTIAVDSHSKASAGTFTLTVSEYTPAANAACAKATELKLVGGKVSTSGDTRDAVNEYGSQITCNSSSYLTGPQLYYKVALTAKQAYKLSLTPSYHAHAYVFPQNGCGSVASINKACGSSGSGVHGGPMGPAVATSVVFTPSTSGSYVVAVDSSSASQAGPFTLAMATFATAKNGSCSKAPALKLDAGKVTQVSGDTTGIKNEHSAVKCGASYALNGSQLYYSVTLAAGKTYRLALTPATHIAYMHIFVGGSCTKDGKKIEAACASKGKTGDVVGPVASGTTGELYFSPATAGSYVIAVDSLGGGHSGAFTLQVGEHDLKAPATFTAPISWDFDSSCQNLGKSGDWQCGTLAFVAGKNCDALSGTDAPKNAVSGKGLWGTRLNDCHSPGSNAKTACSNANPYDDSMLYFAVSLPKTWSKATLSYYSFDDYFLPFDWSEVRINGKVVSQNCKGPKSSPVAWTPKNVDLSKYVGQTITVSFHFMASASVNHSGWYIDDLAITGQ